MTSQLGCQVIAAATAAAFAVTGCHHARLSPARWAEVRPAADVGFVVGEVRSSSHGGQLESAHVWVVDSNGILRDSTSTDAAGAFVLGPIPPGAYRLRTRALLHRPLVQPVVVRAGGVDTLRLKLKYDDTGVIVDCPGPERPDGSRGFGSQFCRP